MPRSLQHRPSPQEQAADRETLIALQDMPDYAPFDQVAGISSLLDLSEKVKQAQEHEIRAQKALEAARDAAVGAERKFHDAIVVARRHVKTQYGENSDQVQAVGLKKRIDYKNPTRRPGDKSS